jgi:hypothetical protein
MDRQTGHVGIMTYTGPTEDNKRKESLGINTYLLKKMMFLRLTVRQTMEAESGSVYLGNTFP